MIRYEMQTVVPPLGLHATHAENYNVWATHDKSLYFIKPIEVSFLTKLEA
jgi:hypothetical protein